MEKHVGKEGLPKESVYRHIFCTHYNYAFFHLLKTSVLYVKGILWLMRKRKRTRERILRIAYIVRKDEAKAETKKRADEDETFMSASFDLQRVLNIPVSDAGPVYCSRKFCVYNLTVYEAIQPNNAYCLLGQKIMEVEGAVK